MDIRLGLVGHGVGTLAVALGIGGLGIGAVAAWTAPTAWADSADSAADKAASTRHTAGPRPHQPAAARGVATPTVKPAATQRNSGQSPAASTLQANATAAAQATALKIRGTWQGPVRLRRGSTDAAELSGIAYGTGTGYFAVGDNGATSIWKVDAPVNNRSGRVKSAIVSGGIAAPSMGLDSEGIAVGPDRNKAWVSDEIASSITQYSLLTGLMLGSVTVPSIYRPANVQGNFGLESLAYGAGKLWTANEEALKTDGALSTTTAGSWVRLQRFGGSDLAPEIQYAYRTDPIKAMSPLTDAERSGVVDMVALPDGRVLTLERELGGFIPTFRSRIYLLDFTGATDVSGVASLADGGFTPVSKTRLWQGRFNFANFEGITLGPQLNDGSSTLQLVSDDGQGQMGQRQTLLSLKLKGLPAPATA